MEVRFSIASSMGTQESVRPSASPSLADSRNRLQSILGSASSLSASPRTKDNSHGCVDDEQAGSKGCTGL
ncbi:hypothetical protein CDL15_Pgr012537 [Punica granatum]|uniref:Uncharacterized protein n=1 Tax=Punica granatum TaxID=22663 RepID=A0A218XYJ4_PUNGR|nr:hypothetical protein CDL15_Pgr012537 [Punica granatum]